MKKERLHELIFLAVLVVIIAIVYYNGLFGDFVWDDVTLIKENPTVKADNPSTIFSSLFFPYSKGHAAYYRPITTLSFWLDYHIWGEFSFGFHLTNVVLHIFCVLLFYLLLVKYIPLKRRIIAWLALTIFALHPYHTESVTFISGRTDILSSIFFLLTFMGYIVHRRSGRPLPLYLSIIAFIVGLLSKEIILMFVPIAFLWELLVSKVKDFKKGLVSLAPFVFVALAYLPICMLIISSHSKALRVQGIADNLGIRLFYAPYFLAKYIVLLAAPYYFYSFRLMKFVTIEFGMRELLTLVIIIGYLGLIVAFLLRRKNIEAFWTLFIAVALLPVLNLIPFRGASIAERFLYLPSMGFAVIAAIGIFAFDEIIKRRLPKSSFAVIFSIVLLFSYGAAAHIRNFDWNNSLMVYTAILNKNPYSVLGRVNLAGTCLEIGEYEQAIKHAQVAIAGDETATRPWGTLGIALMRMGKYRAAEWALEQLLQRSPQNASTYNYLAVLAEAQNDVCGARRYYKTAIEIYPESAIFYCNLGNLEFKQGNYELSVLLLEEARRLNPDYEKVHLLLSKVYEALGENEKARQSWKDYLAVPGIKVAEFVGDEDAPGVMPPKEKRGD